MIVGGRVNDENHPKNSILTEHKKTKKFRLKKKTNGANLM